jgi:hypothetical protein
LEETVEKETAWYNGNQKAKKREKKKKAIGAW